MIRLTPKPDITIHCAECDMDFAAEDWHFTGMHVMCSGKCVQCSTEYYQEIPINAGAFYPGIINARTGKRSDTIPFSNWYLDGLVDAYSKRISDEVDFSAERLRPLQRDKIAILNTIDLTYGHAIFELLNASYYLRKPDVDLIIVVQKEMRWLVPDGAAEIWVADITFKKAVYWYERLAEKVKNELKGKSNVYICRSFVQADSLDYNIEDYSRVKPFPLEEWDEKLREAPVVTFIWRYDKFWKNLLPKIINNRFSRRLFPSVIQKISNSLQHRWILRFAEKLKEEIPNIDFAIGGMDNRDRKIPGWIKDFRYPHHEDHSAREQCERYAQSHVIIGCNGSSLLLPGSHSGSVIDIVPGDFWAASAGSFPFRVTSIGDTHFRYVLLPKEVTINRLVRVTSSILRDRTLIELHCSSPWRDHDSKLDNYAWARKRAENYKNVELFRNVSGLVSVKRSNTK